MKCFKSIACRTLRWLVVFLLIVVVLPVTGAFAMGSFSQQRLMEGYQIIPRFEPASCMFDLPAGFVEGTDVECGWLVVPEEYENSQGQTIRLGVAVLKSNVPNPAPDPLVMLQGGPGGSTIETYMQTIALIAPELRANRDIILFDQRGTLYTEPSLMCPEYLDLVIETLDQDIPDEESYQLVLDSMRTCRSRLVGEGVNLSAYDSLENAADVDSLRAAMGYEEINLYGVSYGTLLAQHVMRMFPEGLRTVTLDSVVPTNVNFLTGSAQSQYRAFQELFEACREDEDCNSAFPELEIVFFDVVDRLNETPTYVQLTDPETGEKYRAIFDGDTFMSAVFQMMYLTDLIPFMPRVTYDARAGNFDFLSQIYSALVFDRTLSLGMYYTVLCAEDADFSMEDVELEGLPAQISEGEIENAAFFLQSCEMWNVEPLEGPVDEPVSSDIPTLVMSGGFDPITPPAYAEVAARSLANSYSVVIPWGGHSEVTSSECANQIFLDFLDNPAERPDESCIAAHKGIAFVTPGSVVRLPVLSRLLNLEGNTGPQVLLYVLALLFLLTALLVYPIIWLVRLLSGGKKQPAVPLDTAPEAYPAAQGEPVTAAQALTGETSAGAPERRAVLYRLAPWISVLTGVLLLVFTILFIGIAFSLAVSFDYRILIGLPGSSRPIFLLPILAGFLTLVMLVTAVVAWSRKSGTVWGRLYFTLLTLAALVSVGVLGQWGMLTGLFA